MTADELIEQHGDDALAVCYIEHICALKRGDYDHAVLCEEAGAELITRGYDIVRSMDKAREMFREAARV